MSSKVLLAGVLKHRSHEVLKSYLVWFPCNTLQHDGGLVRACRYTFISRIVVRKTWQHGGLMQHAAKGLSGFARIAFQKCAHKIPDLHSFKYGLVYDFCLGTTMAFALGRGSYV